MCWRALEVPAIRPQLPAAPPWEPLHCLDDLHLARWLGPCKVSGTIDCYQGSHAQAQARLWTENLSGPNASPAMAEILQTG